jgi:23S rRNA pseudouridine2604 synthase
MRLNKYLSESGACSRRQADEMIEEGRVTINGVPASLGTQVTDGDEVKLDGELVGAARKRVRPVYIALNKPVGITCTTERHVAGNIVDFVDHDERVFPIGRLDKDSEGLILLTNDGDIVNEILRVEHGHEKDYVVGVDRSITPEFIAGIAGGVRLSDATTKPCQIEKLGPKVFRITLTQGLNRQIRRMAEAFGYTVVTLQRIRIMHIRLGELPLGRWRNLSEAELAGLIPQRSAPSRGPASASPSSVRDQPRAARPAARSRPAGGPPTGRRDGARPSPPPAARRSGGSFGARPSGGRGGGGGRGGRR